MAICPIIVHFSTWRARSMHDVTCEFACAETISTNVLKWALHVFGGFYFQLPIPLKLI